jgi:hypothetical protein
VGEKGEIFLGFQLEAVKAIMVELEMAKPAMIPSLLQVVFEMRGLVVLFGV